MRFVLTIFVILFASVVAEGGSPEEVRKSGQPQQESPAPPGQALVKATVFLEGRIDLSEPSGSVTIRRNTLSEWSLTFKDYSGLPTGGLCIIVPDKGPVNVGQGGTNNAAQDWLASEKNGTAKSPPDEAFQKATDALKNWYGHSDNLYSLEGRIIFFRARTKDRWIMDVSGYPRMRLGGYWITVQDEGKVEVSPLP